MYSIDLVNFLGKFLTANGFINYFKLEFATRNLID